MWLASSPNLFHNSSMCKTAILTYYKERLLRYYYASARGCLVTLGDGSKDKRFKVSYFGGLCYDY